MAPTRDRGRSRAIPAPPGPAKPLERATSGRLGIGLALVTASALALEIELTRIFSVTMWYHFAFLAISVAMFGACLGAVIVFVRSGWFPAARLGDRLALVTIGFAWSIPLALGVHLLVPFTPVGTLPGMLSVLGTYVTVLVPFTLAGMVVTLVLTRHPRDSARLYGMDLAGAALGCLAVFAFMSLFDGPTAVLAVGLPAAAAAWAFRRAEGAEGAGGRTRLGLATAALVGLVAVNAATGFMHIGYTKNEFGFPVPVRRGHALIERWNPMSRIVVYPGGNTPFAWGLSPLWWDRRSEVESKPLFIDNAAATAVYGFKGAFEELQFLGADVSSLPYYGMPPGGSVAVVGVGGGKDILTALYFKAGHVLGIEVNRDILRLLENDLADFSGRLAQRADVRLVGDEARSYLSRSGESFDVIQASLIDSWAATAAGAFVLTENGLYTVEGWETFLSRLTPSGVVAFSRWYVADQPGEVFRLVSVATAALRRLGVRDVASHLFLAAAPPPPLRGPLPAVATLIVSRAPLDASRVEAYRRACERLRFDVLLASGTSARPELGAMVDDRSRAELIRRYPLDLTPATDDRPFFFNMVRPAGAFSANVRAQGITDFNVRSVRLLVWLLAALSAMAGLAILVPLRLHLASRSPSSGTGWAAPVYFAAIGLGFMLVEMGQVERLSLYLGHPTYGLAVVLAGILLSAGLGSLASGKAWPPAVSRRGSLVRGSVVLAVLAAFVLATPAIVRAAAGFGLGARLALASALVALPGFFMGMPMPVGLALAGARCPERLPWLWGINGACSVVGSVVGVLISIGWGITASMAAGLACYALGGFFLAAPRSAHRHGA